MIPHRTESVHFFVLMSAATKSLEVFNMMAQTGRKVAHGETLNRESE